MRNGTGGGANTPSESSGPSKIKNKMTGSGSAAQLKHGSEKSGKEEKRKKSPDSKREREDKDKKVRRGTSRDEPVSITLVFYNGQIRRKKLVAGKPMRELTLKASRRSTPLLNSSGSTFRPGLAT